MTSLRSLSSCRTTKKLAEESDAVAGLFVTATDLMV
jgi:hypothetical protein